MLSSSNGCRPESKVPGQPDFAVAPPGGSDLQRGYEMFSGAGPCSGWAAWPGMRFRRLSKRARDSFSLGMAQHGWREKAGSCSWWGWLLGTGCGPPLGNVLRSKLQWRAGQGPRVPCAGQTDLERSSSLPTGTDFPKPSPAS